MLHARTVPPPPCVPSPGFAAPLFIGFALLQFRFALLVLGFALRLEFGVLLGPGLGLPLGRSSLPAGRATASALPPLPPRASCSPHALGQLDGRLQLRLSIASSRAFSIAMSVLLSAVERASNSASRFCTLPRALPAGCRLPFRLLDRLEPGLRPPRAALSLPQWSAPSTRPRAAGSRPRVRHLRRGFLLRPSMPPSAFPPRCCAPSAPPPAWLGLPPPEILVALRQLHFQPGLVFGELALRLGLLARFFGKPIVDVLAAPVLRLAPRQLRGIQPQLCRIEPRVVGIRGIEPAQLGNLAAREVGVDAARELLDVELEILRVVAVLDRAPEPARPPGFPATWALLPARASPGGGLRREPGLGRGGRRMGWAFAAGPSTVASAELAVMAFPSAASSARRQIRAPTGKRSSTRFASALLTTRSKRGRDCIR